jgi:hypothetical protein
MVNTTRWYPAAQSVVCFHVCLMMSFNYSYCFFEQIFPLQNVFLGSGTTQPTCHTSLDSGGGQP